MPRKPPRGVFGRVYDPVDPDYTMTRRDIMERFNWTLGGVLAALARKGFPQPKRFGQNVTRWHPDHVEAWLKARNGEF